MLIKSTFDHIEILLTDLQHFFQFWFWEFGGASKNATLVGDLNSFTVHFYQGEHFVMPMIKSMPLIGNKFSFRAKWLLLYLSDEVIHISS